MAIKEQKCLGCRMPKPLEDFYTHRKGPRAELLHIYCIQCEKWASYEKTH